MAVTTPCYCTREDVKRAVDMKETARNNWQIDRAIQSAARNIEGHMHRTFYPLDTTRRWDWPNFQAAYPWRIWFDASELADVTVNVPVVTSGGNVIPNSAIFWGHPNYSPPYTYLELDRSKSASFGQGNTPQRDVAITGTFGFGIDTDPAGQLAAAMSDTTGTVAKVSDGSLMGVGDLLIVDSERMLVSQKASLDSGQTNLSGATAANMADVGVTVTDGTQLHVDEYVQIDSERMLIVDITGNLVTVKRAWDGSVLAVHAPGSKIFVFRTLTVARGQLGTAAATHLISAAASIHRVPSLIRDLAVAEATNRVLEETGGYADPQGEGAAAIHGLGSALADLWDEATTAYGRKARRRTV